MPGHALGVANMVPHHFSTADDGHSCHVYAISLSHLGIAMQAMKVAVYIIVSAPLQQDTCSSAHIPLSAWMTA